MRSTTPAGTYCILSVPVPMRDTALSICAVSVCVPAVMLIGLLRYALVIERHQNCVLNTAGLSTCWVCAAGLLTAGNFQVNFNGFRRNNHSLGRYSVSLRQTVFQLPSVGFSWSWGRVKRGGVGGGG